MQKKKISIVCEICYKSNYPTNKSNTSVKRIQIKKYCRFCRQHTLHKEEK